MAHRDRIIELSASLLTPPTMLVNNAKAEASLQHPTSDNGAYSKKSAHSPWTAAKPRKRINRQADGDDYAGANGIAHSLHSDENAPPGYAAATSTSLDVNMLASGLERLRVFRKAAGVKGARHGPSARRQAPDTAQTDAASAQFHSQSTSTQPSVSSSFLTGVNPLRTASEPVVRAPHADPSWQQGLQGPGYQLQQDMTCCTPQNAQDMQGQAARQTHEFLQPFGIPASVGAVGKSAREGLRATDLTALSADGLLMGAPASRPTGQARIAHFDFTTQNQHGIPHTSDGPTTASTVAGSCPDGMAFSHDEPGGSTGSGATVHSSSALDEDDDTLDDHQPFMLPATLCMDGDDDVWAGCQQEEEFRIMTRPLRGPSDDGRVVSGSRAAPGVWDVRMPRAAGALYTPTTANCTPRVLVSGFAVTPVSTFGVGRRSSSGGGAHMTPGAGGGCGGDGTGQYSVRQYGRVGYFSGATSDTPRPRAARRAPTPAGHLLRRAFEDDLDEDAEEDYPQGHHQPTPAGAFSQQRGHRGVDGTLMAAAQKLFARKSAGGGMPNSPAMPGSNVAAAPSQPQRSIPRVAIFSPAAAQGGEESDAAPGRRQHVPLRCVFGGRRAGRRITQDHMDDLAAPGGTPRTTYLGGGGGVGQSLLDLAAKELQDQEAMANLMCDECDFCTPPHSPKILGLPHWLHSERRSEMRRTHSADEAMMAAATGSHHKNHPISRLTGHNAPAMHHAVSYQGVAGVQWAAGSLDAAMELGQHVCMEWGGEGAWAPHEQALLGAGLFGMQCGGAERMMAGQSGRCGKDEEMSASLDMNTPVDCLVALDEFNSHLSLAAEHGDRGRAERLWGELRGRSMQPDMRTLNMLMRCLSKSVIDPDEAEELMCEVCTLGGLQPNATTMTLLAEMRHRYEHIHGVS